MPGQVTAKMTIRMAATMARSRMTSGHRDVFTGGGGGGEGGGAGGGGGGGSSTITGAGCSSAPQRMQMIPVTGFGSVHAGQLIDAGSCLPAVPGSRRRLSPLPPAAAPSANSVDRAQNNG